MEHKAKASSDKGIAKRQFHSLLAKASRPIKKGKSDSGSSGT